MKVSFVRKNELVAIDISRIVISQSDFGAVAMCYPVGSENLDDVIYINLFNCLGYTDVDILDSTASESSESNF